MVALPHHSARLRTGRRKTRHRGGDAPAPDLSGQLARARQRARLSLSDVARRAGTSAATVCRYERGWSRFELYTLRKLATALGCRLTVRLDPALQQERRVPAAAAARAWRRLFWDHPLCKADLRRHPVWTAERVLEYGNLEDVRLLRGYYGRDRLLALVQEARFGSARTRAFWTAMLKMEGLSCTKKFSRNTAWNC